VGVSLLSNLKDLTLTLSESLTADGWADLAALTALTSLNINAWGDVVRIQGHLGRGRWQVLI
jgi:hypothetical protein